VVGCCLTGLNLFVNDSRAWVAEVIGSALGVKVEATSRPRLAIAQRGSFRHFRGIGFDLIETRPKPLHEGPHDVDMCPIP